MQLYKCNARYKVLSVNECEYVCRGKWARVLLALILLLHVKETWRCKPMTVSFGSGSARIRMFLPCPDPDPDPHKFADPDPGKKARE